MSQWRRLLSSALWSVCHRPSQQRGSFQPLFKQKKLSWFQRPLSRKKTSLPDRSKYRRIWNSSFPLKLPPKLKIVWRQSVNHRRSSWKRRRQTLSHSQTRTIHCVKLLKALITFTNVPDAYHLTAVATFHHLNGADHHLLLQQSNPSINSTVL